MLYVFNKARTRFSSLPPFIVFKANSRTSKLVFGSPKSSAKAIATSVGFFFPSISTALFLIPIFIFVLYLGGRAIMTGFSAKSTNKSNLEIDANEESENSLNDTKNLTSELNKLNELFESGALTQEEFEKAKKKILDN